MIVVPALGGQIGTEDLIIDEDIMIVEPLLIADGSLLITLGVGLGVTEVFETVSGSRLMDFMPVESVLTLSATSSLILSAF